MKITQIDLEQVGVKVTNHDVEYDCLALSNSILPNSLSFVDDEKYLVEINKNKNIVACFATEELSERIIEKDVFVVEDSRYTFYTLYNYLGRKNYKKVETKIAKSAIVSENAFICKYNVIIGENTIIEPNVTILADVVLGDNCIIRAGAVLGSEGFEHKRTKKGIVSVFHDGEVKLGNNVEIGANTCIDKGFKFRQTIIEDNVRIDNLIHIAHGVQIKNGAYIIAGTVLGGSSTIEEEAWLSINSSIAPGVTVKKKGYVSMGAVVSRDVDEGQQVTGNLAVDHKKFITAFKNFLKAGS